MKINKEIGKNYIEKGVLYRTDGSTLQQGQKVIVESNLIDVRGRVGWIYKEPLKMPNKQGIIIGFRNIPLQRKVVWLGEEIGRVIDKMLDYEWIVLVSLHPCHKPIRILPEHCHVKTT